MTGKKVYQSSVLQLSHTTPPVRSSWGWQAARGPDLRALWERAQSLISGGDWAAAEPVLREILQQVPGDPTAHFYLGQIEFGRRANVNAARHFRQADQGGLGIWQVKYMLACSLWELQDFASAAQFFAQVEPAIPPDVEQAKKLAAGIMQRAIDQEVPAALWRDALRYLDERCTPSEWEIFVNGCGFHHGAPPKHNVCFFENLLIPLMRLALDRGEFQSAMNLHRVCLEAIAILPHTQEQWAWCFSRLNPLFSNAGERYRDQQPSLPGVGELAEPIVAIIVDPAVSGGSGLAMLMNILQQIAPARGCGIVPVVYSMQIPSPGLVAICQRLEIPLVDFGALAVPDFSKDRLVAMRERSRKDGVSVAVYTSTYEGFVCLASSMGLAPVQIYLTFGFHSLDTPGIDAYLACASLGRGERQIWGRKWLTLPFPFPDTFPADDSPQGIALRAEGASIRAEWVGKTIVGTLARSEKLDDLFIETLAEILHGNPDTVFLWFGDESQVVVLNRIRSLFERFGVTDRCFFKGWVNTQVYAHVLDVHLDCFGLPTGLTMAETFSAGTAYVLKRGVESAHIGMTAMLASVADAGDDENVALARDIFRDSATGDELMMLADDTSRYVALANRLIRDAVFRAKVGRAAKRFMATFFHDSNHMGRVFSEIVTETIAESRNTTGTEDQPASCCS